MISRTRIITFLAGFEAFHALLHAYLGASKRTRLEGHPVEELGIKATPRFHTVAAIANGAVAIALGAWALSHRPSGSSALAT